MVLPPAGGPAEGIEPRRRTTGQGGLGSILVEIRSHGNLDPTAMPKPAPPRARNHRPRERPHVALIIETSLAPGREILRGVARYVREHGPWSTFLEPRSLEESVPGWLADWDGDGIIARVQNQPIARAVLAAGIATVDVLGVTRPGAGS